MVDIYKIGALTMLDNGDGIFKKQDDKIMTVQGKKVIKASDQRIAGELSLTMSDGAKLQELVSASNGQKPMSLYHRLFDPNYAVIHPKPHPEKNNKTEKVDIANLGLVDITANSTWSFLLSDKKQKPSNVRELLKILTSPISDQEKESIPKMKENCDAFLDLLDITWRAKIICTGEQLKAAEACYTLIVERLELIGDQKGVKLAQERAKAITKELQSR